MSTKLILDQDSVNINFFANTRLLGIIAPLKNYYFCWQLNNMLGVQFRLNNDLEMKARRKNRNYFYNVYEWGEPGSFLSHYLYHNQNDGEYLLSEFKNMDYIWLMKGDMVEKERLAWFIKSIKNIEGVQLVTELSSDKIKEKNKGQMVF